MLKRIFVAAFALLFLCVAGIATLYLTIPASNTALTHFDTIIVLGYPASPDGTPSPEQRARTLEGVREYRTGVAPRIIMTGGPAHNRYVEAHVMAQLAAEHGVPRDAILEESRARNTIQNAYYSVEIMKSHGWHSAEVVSSPSHLPRASLIFRHFPVEWRMHASPWPATYRSARIWGVYSAEALYTSRLRVFGFRPTPFLPEKNLH